MNMPIYQTVFFVLFILELSSGKRCSGTGAPVVNMCSNQVKTRQRIFLDINIKPEDNINNCSCTLQLIQPGTVTFTPLHSDNWCYYSLTVTHVATTSITGIHNCKKTPQSTQLQLKPKEIVDILLKNEPDEGSRNVTRCMDIQSAAGTSFNISCSLPNNQQPPTVATTDTHTPMFTSSVTLISTTTDVNRTSASRGGPHTDSHTQEKKVGAIVGGVVGAIVVIGIIIVIVLVIFLRKRRQEKGESTGQTSMGNSGFVPSYENVVVEQLDSSPINDHRLSTHYSEISDTNRVAVVKPQPRFVQTEGTYNTVDEPPISDHYNEAALSPSDIPQTTNNEPTDHYTLVDLPGEAGAQRTVNVPKPKPPPPDLATKPKTSKKPKFPVNFKELYAVVNKPKTTEEDLSTNGSTPTQVGDIYTVVNKPNKDTQIKKPDVQYAVVNKNR